MSAVTSTFIGQAAGFAVGGAAVGGCMLYFAKFRINKHSCYNTCLQMVQDHPKGRKFIGNQINGGGVEWDSRVEIGPESNKLHFRVTGNNGRGIVFAKAQSPQKDVWNVQSLVLEVITTSTGEPGLVPIYPSKDSAVEMLANSVKKTLPK